MLEFKKILLYLLIFFIFLSLFLFFPLHFLCFSFFIFLISVFIPLLLQCPDPQNCLITVLNMLRCVGHAKEPGDKLFCTIICYYSVYEYSQNIFVSRLIQRYFEMLFNHTGKQGMFHSTFPSKGGIEFSNTSVRTNSCETRVQTECCINPLKPELNPICYLLALLRAHHFLHVSMIRVKLLTFRLLMSYTYGAPILDVSRSHTTTHHGR